MGWVPLKFNKWERTNDPLPYTSCFIRTKKKDKVKFPIKLMIEKKVSCLECGGDGKNVEYSWLKCFGCKGVGNTATWNWFKFKKKENYEQIS